MPQKNHYLPVFYQKRWAGTDGRVYSYSRPHKAAIVLRRHPSAVGYETDLYTVRGGDPVVASYLEQHFFKTTDDLGARALATIERGQWNPMEAHTRSNWTRFVMSLLHRTPEEIRAIFDLVSKFAGTARQIFETRYVAIKNASDPATFEEYWKAQLSDFIGRIWITATQRTIDSRKIGEHINNLFWRVIEIHGYYTFMTCDRPIVMTNGLDKPDGHLALPIGPRKLFVAAKTHQVAQAIAQLESDELAVSVNDRVVHQARRFCIATNDTLLRFFDKRFGEQLPSSPLDGIMLTDEGASMLMEQFEAALDPKLFEVGRTGEYA